MLTCIPQSICSWNFRVPDASSGPALVEFNFLTEQGRIVLGNVEYAVRKHGWLSGKWTLERNGECVVESLKPSALFRSFDVEAGTIKLTVKARSALGRSYEILANGNLAGTIQPAHAFTRRAFIDCDSSIPELVQLFSFWLAALTWKRAAKSSNSGTVGA